MPGYFVSYCKPEHWSLWFEFNSGKPSPEASKVSATGALGLCNMVQAKDEASAREKILALNPGYKIVEVSKVRTR